VRHTPLIALAAMALLFVSGCGGGSGSGGSGTSPSGTQAAACLSSHGYRARYTPVPPQWQRSDPNSPDGELAAANPTRPTSVMAAYYDSEAHAKQYEPSLSANARRIGGFAIRRGKVTLLYLLKQPTADDRRVVEACVF
jgi:hypothetical protein